MSDAAGGDADLLEKIWKVTEVLGDLVENAPEAVGAILSIEAELDDLIGEAEIRGLEPYG